MNREEASELFPIIKAFSEGKVIQTSVKGKSWEDLGENIAFYTNDKYRIKPESKYRPFANAEECWNEMQKHQPFGWIKCKEGYFSVVYVNDEYAGLGDKYDSSILLASKNSYTDNTFVDGTPFGVKVEEN